mgnify:CR=1 FL=1
MILFWPAAERPSLRKRMHPMLSSLFREIPLRSGQIAAVRAAHVLNGKKTLG